VSLKLVTTDRVARRGRRRWGMAFNEPGGQVQPLGASRSLD
jgi:hypothetical protein